MEKNPKTQVTFPPEVASVAAARRFVGKTLRSWGVDEVDDAMLLTSELITNAIVHAGTEVTLVCEMLGGQVRVEVHDRHQARRVPVPGDQVSGRGLLFPDSLAIAWGVTYGYGGKQVWFTVPSAPGGEDDLAPPPQQVQEPPPVPQPVRPAVDQLANRAAQTAQDTLGADCVYVLLAEEEAELVLKATAGVRPEGAALEMGLEGAPVGGRGVYADLGGSPYNLPALRAAGIRSLVTAPFVVDTRVIGLLIAASRDAGHFDEDDVERLQRIADRQAPSMERARLMESERARRGWLGFLAEASSLLAGTLDQQMTMALVAQLIVPRLATWCALFTVRESGTALPAYAWHADETMVADLNTLLARLPPVPPPGEPGPWEGFALTADLPDTAHRVAGDVAHIFPMLARGRSIGMLLVGGPKGARFTRDTLELTEDLAGRAGLAIDNARLYEEQADMSRTLQRGLLPPGVPQIPGLDLAVVYEPAGESSEVGGDFYDVFSVGPRWRFAIGDVCGTGPEAASVTGLARHTLRILGRENYSIPDVMERLNALILDEGPRARFLTLLHGEVELLEDGSARVTYVTAGHPPPLFLSPSGVVTGDQESELLLGVFPEATFTARTVVLEPGNVMFGFTDGVTERRNGDRLLGDDGGLERILRGCVDLGAGAIAAKVQRLVRGFSTEPAHDDMALIVMRIEE